MNDAELQQVISDHYLGEAQLLTTGAEENLLKLTELRDTLSAEEAARWAQIKRDFLRNKAMGADDADVGGRMVAQLADIAGGLQALGEATAQPAPALQPSAQAPWDEVLALLQRIGEQRTVGQAEPGEPLPILAALPEAVQSAVAPLLEAMRMGHERQEQINQAVLHLAQALRESAGPARAPAASRRKGPHQPTPNERPLDEALDKLAGLTLAELSERPATPEA